MATTPKYPLPTPRPAVSTTVGAPPKLIHQEDDMLNYMEQDLMQKAKDSYAAKDIKAAIFGCFSLDDLESKGKAELCDKLAIGVGYYSCEPVTVPKATEGAGTATAMGLYHFSFLVLLAVPVAVHGKERNNALKLLTILRRGIAGKTISDDRASRTWTLVNEAPRIPESTPEVLYYAQVWRVALPNVGN